MKMVHTKMVHCCSCSLIFHSTASLIYVWGEVQETINMVSSVYMAFLVQFLGAGVNMNLFRSDIFKDLQFVTSEWSLCLASLRRIRDLSHWELNFGHYLVVYVLLFWFTKDVLRGSMNSKNMFQKIRETWKGYERTLYQPGSIHPSRRQRTLGSTATEDTTGSSKPQSVSIHPQKKGGRSIGKKNTSINP